MIKRMKEEEKADEEGDKGSKRRIRRLKKMEIKKENEGSTTGFGGKR